MSIADYKKTGLVIVGDCEFMTGVFQRFFISSRKFEVIYIANCLDAIEEKFPDDFAGWIIFICDRNQKPDFSNITNLPYKKMPMIFYNLNSDIVDIHLPDKPYTQLNFQSPAQLEEFMLRNTPSIQ